jgi:CheY-like chemotaxis protein
MATVLIVDDDAAIVEMLAEVIADCGHTAMPAYEGITALALARSQQPALILTDVMMPGMDGYELLHAVRADPALSEVPIFLMSASFAKRRPMPDVDADGYLAKPFDLVEVEDLLERLPVQ